MNPMMHAAGEIASVQTTVINNGLDAVKYLAKEDSEVDAVLIDLSMFPTDGLTLVEQIRTLEKVAPTRAPLKLAFFTAQPIDVVIRNAQKEYNVEKIYYKPIDAVSLLKEVKDWIG
jgi:CheY-like chemotaxis protein